MRHVGVNDSMIQESSEADSPRVRAAGQADETDTDEVEAEAEMWGNQKVGEKSMRTYILKYIHTHVHTPLYMCDLYYIHTYRK